MRRARETTTFCSSESKEVRVYLVGRKAKAYFDFRHRDYDEFWTGDTDNANPKRAEELTERLLGDISESYENGGVDEIHLVYTAFKSMVTQEPRVLRLLPLEVVDANNLGDEVAENYQDLEETQNNFEFEPNPEEFLNEVLPRYIKSRIYSSLCHAASSELASRQRAMKAAGDNADELIKKYTRLMNNARQAEITTELTEIVSGAEAL